MNSPVPIKVFCSAAISFIIVAICFAPTDATPIILNYSNVTVPAAATNDVTVPAKNIISESAPILSTLTTSATDQTNDLKTVPTNSSLTTVKRSKKSNDDMMASASEPCAVTAPCSAVRAPADQAAASSGAAKHTEQHPDRVRSAYGFGGHTHSTGFGGGAAYHGSQYGHSGSAYPSAPSYQGPSSAPQQQQHSAYQEPSGYHQSAPAYQPASYHQGHQSYHEQPSHHESYDQQSHYDASPSYHGPPPSADHYEAPAPTYHHSHHQSYNAPEPHQYDAPHHQHQYHHEAAAPVNSHQSYTPAAPAPYQPSYGPSPAYLPAYPALAYPSYPPIVYPTPTYYAPPPSISYTYPSPAPQTPCGSNVLVGCHPTVSSVPCGGYSHAAAPYNGGSYRSANNEEMGAANPNAKKTADDKATSLTEKPTGSSSSTTEAAIKSDNSEASAKQRDALQATQTDASKKEDESGKSTKDGQKPNSDESAAAAAEKQKATMIKMAQMAQMMKEKDHEAAAAAEQHHNGQMGQLGMPHPMPAASNQHYTYHPMHQPWAGVNLS